MRLRTLSGFGLVVLVSAASTPGCGSSDPKKNAPHYTAGGEGGASEGGRPGTPTGGVPGASAAAGTPGAGEAGAPGNVGEAGMGGSQAGAGSTEPNAGAAGDGVGGEGPVIPFNGLYVGKTGDDSAAGTLDAPFATLAHAASVAQAGDTIVFLDGAYTFTGPVPLPADVNLMANTSGAVTLSGQNGTLLNLGGNVRIEGLKFQSYARVAYFGAAAQATGTVTLVDSTFVNCGIGLELSGSVSATVEAADAFVIGNGGNAFATLTQEATLSLTDGILQNYGAGGIIRAGNDSRVTLSSVQVLDGTGEVLLLRDDAVGDVADVTVATVGQNLFEQRNSSELTITGSDLSIKATAANPYYCVLNQLDGTGALTIRDSALHGCATALRGGIYGTMTISGVQFSNHSFGAMDLGYGASGVGGVVRITGSTFQQLGYVALRIGSGNNLNDFKVRTSTFTCAATTQFGCLQFDGSNASSMDLGTLADPGGNTFTYDHATQPAVRFGFQAVNSTAVGNTWTPNVQGADAQGKYNAPAGAGQKLLITMPVAAGRNYQMPYGGTLLLAQNP